MVFLDRWSGSITLFCCEQSARVKNTELYVQLDKALFQGEQDYISKVAKTQEEICNLVEAGFEYVTDFEGAKIFKKPKL